MTAFAFHKQETVYSCGSAAMRMALETCGIKLSETQVMRILRTNKVRGTWHRDFPVVAEKFHLNYAVKRNAEISDLRRLLKDGYVVIVCYYYPPEKVDHYSVVKSIGKNDIAFWDPSWGPEHKYTLVYFRKIWKSDPRYDNEKRWCIALKR